MEYDAILRDYILVDPYGKGNVQIALGNIYADSKGRFKDGDGIRTSIIKSITELPNGKKLAKTLNTTYLLEKPLEAVPHKD